MNMIKKYHLFLPWNDNRVENWLRNMSSQGLHFKSVKKPLTYLFEEGTPAAYIYRLDYFTDSRDKANYLQLFEDAGWEYLGEMGGWQYFRHNITENGEAEIYSDNSSKIVKYKRFLMFILILMPILIALVMIMTIHAVKTAAILIIVILASFMYAAIQLLRRINSLRT